MSTTTNLNMDEIKKSFKQWKEKAMIKMDETEKEITGSVQIPVYIKSDDINKSTNKKAPKKYIVVSMNKEPVTVYFVKPKNNDEKDNADGDKNVNNNNNDKMEDESSNEVTDKPKKLVIDPLSIQFISTFQESAIRRGTFQMLYDVKINPFFSKKSDKWFVGVTGKFRNARNKDIDITFICENETYAKRDTDNLENNYITTCVFQDSDLEKLQRKGGSGVIKSLKYPNRNNTNQYVYDNGKNASTDKDQPLFIKKINLMLEEGYYKEFGKFRPDQMKAQYTLSTTIWNSNVEEQLVILSAVSFINVLPQNKIPVNSLLEVDAEKTSIHNSVDNTTKQRTIITRSLFSQFKFKEYLENFGFKVSLDWVKEFTGNENFLDAKFSHDIFKSGKKNEIVNITEETGKWTDYQEDYNFFVITNLSIDEDSMNKIKKLTIEQCETILNDEKLNNNDKLRFKYVKTPIYGTDDIRYKGGDGKESLSEHIESKINIEELQAKYCTKNGIYMQIYGIRKPEEPIESFNFITEKHDFLENDDNITSMEDDKIDRGEEEEQEEQEGENSKSKKVKKRKNIKKKTSHPSSDLKKRKKK